MPEVITTVGAVAGIGAFVGVSLLALLNFSQGRDIRRLRDWAGRAPERAAEAEQVLASHESGVPQVAEQPVAAESQAATEAQPVEPPPQPAATEAGAPPPPPPPPPPPQQRPPQRPPEEWQIEAEAAAAAELTQRRERIRERDPYTTHRRGGLEVRSPLVVLAGGAILLFAIIFGAMQFLGGDDSSTTPTGSTTSTTKNGGTLTPSKIRVSVLNGTAVPGLAASVGDDVRNAGFKLGAVTNTESSFDGTVVMYKRGHQPEGELVAKAVDISAIELMTAEIQRVSKGADVAIVVGQDRAPAGAEQPGVSTPGVPTTPVTPTPTPTP